MATVAVTINVTTPAGVTPQTVMDELCTFWGYIPPNGQDSPAARQAFIKAQVARYLRESYIAAHATAQAETARRTAATEAGKVTVD